VTCYGQGGLAVVACFACLLPAVFGTRSVPTIAELLEVQAAWAAAER
jgi:hypothetical protein